MLVMFGVWVSGDLLIVVLLLIIMIFGYVLEECSVIGF